jgi:hypothetical protein
MAKRSHTESEEIVEHQLVISDPFMERLNEIVQLLAKMEEHMANDLQMKKHVFPAATVSGPARQPLVAGQQYPRSGDTYGPKK